MQDLRFAFRQLAKNLGFTAVALLSLMLGIGVNTALFSVVYGVLINPYPYAKPYEIWAPSIEGSKENQQRGSYQLNEYIELTKLSAFADVMATGWDSMLLAGEFAPETFRGVLLTSNAFKFLGVPPIIGRTLGPSDIKPNGEAEPVIVISQTLWQRLFNSDPAALGKTLRLNDRPYTIIGVMPSRFGWYGSDTFWLPLALNRHDTRFVNPIARLRPGVSLSAAEQELHALHQRLAQENPSAFPQDGFQTRLTNYMKITVASGEMEASLQLLFGAVGFLLLIACANVANLQLARSTARAKEMAVRISIGAGRGRLVRQLLTESVLLSLGGGVLGLLFAVWTTSLIVALMPEFMVPNEARITMNGYVLAFSIIVSVLTGIIFGLVPALQSTRPDQIEALKDGAKGSAAVAAKGWRTREMLVIAEVALSVVLLVTAGLTIRSFMALQGIDPGFRVDKVLTVGLPLAPQRYTTFEQRNRFAQELVERIRGLPGVEAVAIGNGGLPFGGRSTTFALDGQAESETRQISLSLISSDYLRTLGVPLRQGRTLTDREIQAGDHVALVNEAAVSSLWPSGEDPLGKRIRLDFLTNPGHSSVLMPEEKSPYVTIVGVIGNTRNDGLRNETLPSVFAPYTLLAPPQRLLAIRAQGNPTLMINALRKQVSEMDKDQPLGRPTTVEELMGFQTVQSRFIMALFSLFATFGLILALAGIYSVLSYLVTRRTREIGVRMALGAQRIDILALILGRGGKLIGVGLLLGTLASFAATRLLRSQLFQVTTTDPISFSAVVVLLSTVALAACYVPARRAARVQPIEALRYE